MTAAPDPKRAAVLPALALALLVGCAGAGDRDACADLTPATDEGAGYRLGPGDRLRVTIFRHPDLSGQFALDGEGDLALPLVGDLRAGGMTVREVERELQHRLRDGGFLIEPRASIEVLSYRPFYILGEVGRPGEYAYENGMTVINAVALAGGYTYRANPAKITITRRDCRALARPDTPVLPGEVVTVPERFF